MANTIRIKRSTGSAAPTTLANAELAFTEATKILYIGTGVSSGVTASQINAIGGIGAFVSLGSDAQTIAGVKTFSGAIVLGTPGSGTLSNCTGLSLTAGVTGILPIANGGTGFSTLAAAGFALKGANSDITSITGLTTPLSVAQGGTGSASGVSLTTGVSGILPIVNGGTGSSSGVPLATGVSGVLPVANGGTGFSTLASAGIALRGANTDITSLGGLTTALTVAQGGTGVTTSTGTGSTVLSASPTLTGTANVAALTSSGNVIVGGTLTLSGAPSSDLHAATKAYVDATAQGIDVRASCRVASTANIALSTGTALTIDGVQTVAGNRVLVKNQTLLPDNGIYVVAAGAWSRATDSDTSAEVTAGMFTFVSEGTANADTGWVLVSNDTITLGTTDISFEQFSGAGQIIAGAGLTKSGNTLTVGSSARIVVNADNIDLATLSAPAGSEGGGTNVISSVTADSYGRLTGYSYGAISGLTNTHLSGTAGITNANLANSAVTVGSTSVSLGAAVTTFAGLTSVTSTGFTGALTGNASTATTLATTRAIYGNNFDGSAALTAAIAGTYGGTGVNNGANTITVAGNVSHAGSTFTQTFTATANTSVTLPTSGTLLSDGSSIDGGSYS